MDAEKQIDIYDIYINGGIDGINTLNKLLLSLICLNLKSNNLHKETNPKMCFTSTYLINVAYIIKH